MLGAAAVPVGGALVQGCTLFFQPLVYVVVTRSTRLQGLSPLVAFGVGQALISAVVLAGNLAGKLLFQVAGETPLLLSAVCGAGVLALFFMVVARAAQVGKEGNEEKDGGTEEMEAETRGADRVKAAAAGRGSSGVAAGERLFEDGGTTEAATLPNGDCAAGVGAQGEDSAAVFARAVGLTARETEILSLLVRGRTLPYIANELFVTTGTVKTHVRHIYEKALVNNRQELLDKVEAR